MIVAVLQIQGNQEIQCGTQGVEVKENGILGAIFGKWQGTIGFSPLGLDQSIK